MEYYIAIEVEAFGPMADLTTSLQSAYDAGAAGDFNVLVTRAPSYMVVFKRSVVDDAEYVSKRADVPGVSIETAAMQQLAAELAKGDLCAAAEALMMGLLRGEGNCFDYGSGAIVAMAEFEEEAEA